MDLFLIPRRAARLPYETARLPFTILDECVVAHWDDQSLPRVGFELSLGLTDTVAGWLLADDRISGRGQALLRRTESSAMPGERETTPQARRSQRAENAQEAARQARQQVHETINSATAYQQDQEDSEQARRLVKYHPEEAGYPGNS